MAAYVDVTKAGGDDDGAREISLSSESNEETDVGVGRLRDGAEALGVPNRSFAGSSSSSIAQADDAKPVGCAVCTVFSLPGRLMKRIVWAVGREVTRKHANV